MKLKVNRVNLALAVISMVRLLFFFFNVVVVFILTLVNI